MPGIIPVPGDLTLDGLAATLTKNEQLAIERTTALAIDTSQPRNLVTTEIYDGDVQLGKLAIVARGADSPGTKFLSPTVYISGAKTDVDVYRLPLS